MGQGFGGFLDLRERSSSYINARGAACPLQVEFFCYNLYVVAIAVYRDLASQGLKGFITDEISHLKDLVSL